MDQFEQIFRSGELAMADTLSRATEAAVSWSGLLSNRILVTLSVVMFMFLFPEIIRFFPDALYCIRIYRGSIHLEHSFSKARSRNVLALCHLLPFCLLCDRYSLYRIEGIPAGWSAISLIGVAFAYLLTRHLAYVVINPRKRMSADCAQSAHRAIYTFFVTGTWLLLAVCGSMAAAGAAEDATRTVLLCLLAGIYAFSFYRTAQILASECTGLSTILYLCALEILPTGLLVASSLYV